MRLVAATRFSFATSPGIDPALYYFAAALHTINYTPTKGIPCHTTLSRSSVRGQPHLPRGKPGGTIFFSFLLAVDRVVTFRTLRAATVPERHRGKKP